jgi:hypothetical protein
MPLVLRACCLGSAVAELGVLTLSPGCLCLAGLLRAVGRVQQLRPHAAAVADDGILRRRAGRRQGPPQDYRGGQHDRCGPV